MDLANKKYFTNRRLIRMSIVMTIYHFQLLNEKIDSNKIFEEDFLNEWFNYSIITKKTNSITNEIYQIISIIENNYEQSKMLIEKYIDKTWSWQRLSPLLKSILLCAIAEMNSLEIKILLNEYIEITKDFIPDDSYKFVNVVLEKIWKEKNGLSKEN